MGITDGSIDDCPVSTRPIFGGISAMCPGAFEVPWFRQREKSPRYPNRSIQRAVSPSPWSFLAIDVPWTCEHHNCSVLHEKISLVWWWCDILLMVQKYNTCDIMWFHEVFLNMSLTSWARLNKIIEVEQVCWTWIEMLLEMAVKYIEDELVVVWDAPTRTQCRQCKQVLDGFNIRCSLWRIQLTLVGLPKNLKAAKRTSARQPVVSL